MDEIIMVAIATNKLEPLLTPNTQGPAKGLRNKLCINKPHKAKPEPAIMDVIVLGNLISYKIEENIGSDVSKLNKLVLPKYKAHTERTAKTSSSNMVVNMNLDFVNG